MPRPERPVDPAKGAIQEFAVALRELREHAGGPTYRSLAERTGLSVSTLADAAGGRRLPTFAVAVAYAVACGGDEHEWAARWRAVAEGEVSPERAPYRGLAGFRGEDADLFFGRERLAAELVDRVRSHPVTVVLGASGAGKSSLLAAGLVPALAPARPVIMTPGEHPSDRLPARGDVLVIDQFEELYTLCAPAERARFLDDVLARPDLRVVVSVRADYFGRLAEHPVLAEALRANQVLVGPMSADELRDAMTRPAAAVGLSVERALVATVLQEAKGRAGVLPLLSHAMLETWRRRRGTVLTLACFEAAGGIDGALVRTAEETYGSFDAAQRALAAELLLRMLSIDESVARRRVDLADVRSVDPAAGVVIDRLADARLVTVDGGSVEIAHDAMLQAWPRLRAWVDDHREAVRGHRKISEAARLWVENERDPSVLASGARLDVMKAHTSELAGVLRLSRVEKDFLEQSDDLARRTALTVRRRTVRQCLLVVAAVVAVIAAAVFAEVADQARTDATATRDSALSQRIAATVQNLRLTDPAVAAQLAVAGYRIAPTSEARSTLLESTAAPVPARYLGAGSTALVTSPSGALVAVSDVADGSVTLFTRTPHGLTRAGVITSVPSVVDRPVSTAARLYALTFLPDNRVLAVGDSTGMVSLWDVAVPRMPVRLSKFFSGVVGPIERLAVDPTGVELAAVVGDEVTRWSIGDRTRPQALPGIHVVARVRSVAYARAGGLLAFGTDAGRAHVWSVRGVPTEVTVLAAHDKPAMVSFAPDGQLLLRGANDEAVRLWDVTSSPARPGRVLDSLTDLGITTAEFSQDGRYLVASAADSTAYVLETTTWTQMRKLPHPDSVAWAAFAGDAVVTAARDGAVRWWPLSDAVQARAPAPIGEVRYSADGTGLAVFADGSVFLRNKDVRQTLRGQYNGEGDLSRDGRLLATGTDEGDVVVFDVADPARPIATLTGAGKKMEFSPDGSLLATGADDGTVRIWRLDHPDAPVTQFRALSGEVLDVSWRPLGQQLAVAGADAHVYLFDARDPRAPRRLARLDGSRGQINSAVFNPAGTLLATAGVDGIVRLWDVRDPTTPHLTGSTASAQTGRILEVSFNPGGNELAASVIDGTVWLWHIDEPAHPTRAAVLADSTSPLNTVAFRPNGDILTAGGVDRVVHTWHTAESAVMANICAGVGDEITPTEWRTHLPDVPYDPPCRQ